MAANSHPRRNSIASSLVKGPKKLDDAFMKLHFNIDKYLNPLIPRSRLHQLPKPISHFLGYRDAPKRPIGNIAIATWALIGGFIGTSVLSGFFMSDFIKEHSGPIIIGSYGAAAVLEYNAIESPFAQPRNAIVGQFISALVGVCVTKLFAMDSNFENIRWVAGSLAVGIASAAMTLTGTVYPPAGATALLAAIDQKSGNLGWLYLPVVLVSALLTTAVACILNNIHRQFPMYWWTPRTQPETTKPKDEERDADEKKAEGEDIEAETHWRDEVHISNDSIKVPESFYLSAQERTVLSILSKRLHEVQSQSSDTEAGDSDSEHKKMKRTDTNDESQSDGHSHDGHEQTSQQ